MVCSTCLVYFVSNCLCPLSILYPRDTLTVGTAVYPLPPSVRITSITSPPSTTTCALAPPPALLSGSIVSNKSIAIGSTQATCAVDFKNAGVGQTSGNQNRNYIGCQKNTLPRLPSKKRPSLNQNTFHWIPPPPPIS